MPSSSPPTTATIRPSPAPTTRASACRCWPSGRACVPARIWACASSFCDLGQTVAEALRHRALALGTRSGRRCDPGSALRVGVKRPAPGRTRPHRAQKRDGGELPDDEIRALIIGAAGGEHPRLSALGPADGDRVARHDDPRARHLAGCDGDLGQIVCGSAGPRASRSTSTRRAGVGDKISLCLAPLVAACGVRCR